MKKIIFIIIFILVATLVTAMYVRETSNYMGNNITNISHVFSDYLCDDSSCDTVTSILATAGNITDTNETTRMDRVVATNCTGEVVAGFYVNGTGYCESDDTGVQWPINTTEFTNNSGTLTSNQTWWRSIFVVISTLANYINWGNESNLNVNKSNYWDTYNIASDLNYKILSYWMNITGRPTHLLNFTDNIDYSSKDVNYSDTSGTATTWDGETSQADLNVNYSEHTNNSNINITESQVNDLNHTVDTSAFVNCSDGEYFDGSGSCPNFNDTVNSIIGAIFYNATSIDLVDGTLDDGSVTEITNWNEGSYNISEQLGDDWIIYINYTSIMDFNNIILRVWYDAADNKMHDVHVGLWEWDDDIWDEEFIPTIEYAGEFEVYVYEVFDVIEHINNSRVRLRLRHDPEGDQGRANHDFRIDYAVLTKGFTGFVPSGVPSLQSVVDAGNTLNGDSNIISDSNFTLDTLFGDWNNSPLYMLLTNQQYNETDLMNSGENLSMQEVYDNHSNSGYLTLYENRTDADIIEVINGSAVTVDCDNINFSGTIGSASICDGDDAEGAGAYDLNVSGDSGIGVILGSEVLAIECGANCSTVMSGNTLTINAVDTDTTYTAGNKLYLNGEEFNVNDTEINTSIEAYGYITTYLNLTDADILALGYNHTTDLTILYDSKYITAYLNLTGDDVVKMVGNYSNLTAGTNITIVGDLISVAVNSLQTFFATLFEPISSWFDASTTTNITCFNSDCDWYMNASNSCLYWPSGGRECDAGS